MEAGTRRRRSDSSGTFAMTQTSTPDYTLGFSEAILEAFRRFTAESQASHLLPHLSPGQRLLDFGCGPGNISVGLASAVSPGGEMHGIDMEASQVELARQVAEARGVDNAIYHVADVADLPFEDDFFDVAHCHNVLMHIPDTQAALAEVRRVMKPGGILACREMVNLGSFTHPDYNIMDKSWGIFSDLLAADDGHPYMGRELKGHLVKAGFQNIKASVNYDIYSDPDGIEFVYNIAQQWFLSDEIMDAAIKYGAATESLRDGIRVAYDRWREHPGAFCAIAHGTAIARMPA